MKRVTSKHPAALSKPADLTDVIVQIGAETRDLESNTSLKGEVL